MAGGAEPGGQLGETIVSGAGGRYPRLLCGRMALAVGQLDHVRDQAILVVTPARDTALGRTVLSQHPTGPPFRDPEPAADMVDALATTRGAQMGYSARRNPTR